MLPYMSNKMFPLCLSLSLRTYVSIEDPARELTNKFFALFMFYYVSKISVKNLSKEDPYVFFFISSIDIEFETNSKIPEFSLKTIIS